MAQCGVCSTCGTPAGTTGGSHISVAVGDDKQSFNEVVNVGRFDPPDIVMNHFMIFHDFSIHRNVPPVMLHGYLLGGHRAMREVHANHRPGGSVAMAVMS